MGETQWCIAHKPRSGKSITMLLICKYLLENGRKKILITTSVPSTIDSFIATLDTWLDFAGIRHTTLSIKNGKVSRNFTGIVFCSTQYLKADKYGVKKSLLKRAEFDAIFIDESHHGSSTQKTKTGILDAAPQNAKLKIFASGTAERTRRFYKIPRECVFEWDMDDEAYMKTDMVDETIQYMNTRHTEVFEECLRNTTLNRDYKNTPSQVLIKHVFSSYLEKQILEYNKKYGTDYGFSFSSLLALRSVKKRGGGGGGGGGVENLEEFEIAATEPGRELLVDVLDYFISSNPMRDTIMKEIEKTQTNYESRKSTRENPLLFIIYLPLSSIALLQKTLKKFLKDNGLWVKYNIEFSNANGDSGDTKEEYNEFLQTIMEKTKRDGKIGCILFLGNKGSVGVTYHECDVTISLDDGHSLDNQKQRYSRALTEAAGKTIGINVDMNVQRTYTYILDVIAKYRKNTRSQKSNAEILQFLYQHKIFMFNPQKINYGNVKTAEITNYYKSVAEEIRNAVVDDTPFLEGIICDDDMRDYINANFRAVAALRAEPNPDLVGENTNLPKGGVEKTEIDPLQREEEEAAAAEAAAEIINKTYEMCKTFLFPLLALISRSYNIDDFKDIFTDARTRDLVISLLRDKKIELTTHKNICIVINIMNVIIDNNQEIVNSIREIYRSAPAHKLRGLIAKHFIPTAEEQQENAEVPTPVALVDEMLAAVPREFWCAPRRVFEPCCGKGNFVLGIFDRFYEGLADAYPDPAERCRVIMRECLYYADLTALNVFITTELLKCHIESKCGADPEYEFYSHAGDTLELDCDEKWRVAGFDAVIGNPPYQPASNGKKGGKSLWNDFVEFALSSLLIQKGYLVFIHPALWRKPGNKIRDLMFSKQIHYLSIHNKIEGKKVFGATTRYDYYLLENIPTYKNTHVVFEDKKEYNIFINTELPFIPNFGWCIFNKVFKKLQNNGINAICDSGCHTSRPYVSKVKKEGYIYVLLNSISKSKGKTFAYSSKPHKSQTNKKVLFSNGETIVPFYDNGELGVTQGGIYVIVDNENEGNRLVDFLNTKLVVYLIKATKWSNFETSKQLFWYIPFPAVLHEINDDTINTYFELTEEEKQIIN
jgi:hypothetical protein